MDGGRRLAYTCHYLHPQRASGALEVLAGAKLPRHYLVKRAFDCDSTHSAGGDAQAVLSLGNLCPALRYSSVEGGAGFYQGTQALFGYIIHMAAVVALFEPE